MRLKRCNGVEPKQRKRRLENGLYRKIVDEFLASGEEIAEVVLEEWESVDRMRTGFSVYRHRSGLEFGVMKEYGRLFLTK